MNRILLSLFILLISVSVFAQEKIPKKARKLFEEYKEAAQLNDYQKALISLKAAIKVAPDYLDARRELGYYYKDR